MTGVQTCALPIYNYDCEMQLRPKKQKSGSYDLSGQVHGELATGVFETIKLLVVARISLFEASTKIPKGGLGPDPEASAGDAHVTDMNGTFGFF